MSDYQPFSKEVRDRVGNRGQWVFLILFMMGATAATFLYSIFNWMFTWYLPMAFILFLTISYRYGRLLREAEETLEEEDR